MFEAAETIAGLPHLPGVYRMLGGSGEVLYVGKALDLRKRVASYFQRQEGLSPRIQVMLGQVAAIETTVTRSEAEALLLENNLIKALSPRYNILFRDDKSYPYLVLTGHQFPRLGFHRGPLNGQHRYYGPFPNAGAVRESIQLIQKVFRIRTCEDTVFSHRSRPCLLHQIRRCTAPCVGLIAEAAYIDDVRSADLFLSGKEDEVIDRVTARMTAAAESMRYEQAAEYRDQIAALRKVREKQFVSDQGRDADVVASATAGGVVCVNLVMIRAGHHLGDRNFFPRNADGANPEQVVEAFLLQHYLDHVPPGLIVAGGRLDPGALEQVLTERARQPVRLLTNPTGARRAWHDMAARNAELGARQQLSLQTTQSARLTALQQALDLQESAQRIECFDVSHTMGEGTVASCVVYDRSAFQKSEYRRYNIAVKPADEPLRAAARSDAQTPSVAPAESAHPTVNRQSSAVASGDRLAIAGGDDYAAMRDVLTRRYSKLAAGEGKTPDLVMIDGGKGQLAVACEVFADLGLTDIPVLAVAKGEERKPGMEQLLLPGRPEALRLPSDHAALHLIQQVRDEAHRFAIEGHRARRGKARTTSPLEAIRGIGTRRRQKLLAHFGGLRGLVAASVDELAEVAGVSRALAERIYNELH